MRRIIACLLSVLLLLSAALAEESAAPALSEMTLPELHELRERIDARIAELESAAVRLYYESGTYRVGVDMPEGVYLLKDDGMALFPSVLVRVPGEGAQGGEVISYELVLPTAVIRLVSGTFVTLTDITAYPFENAPQVGLDEGGAAVAGGYWVGAQIPEGYYRVVPDEAAPLSSYSVYDDVPGAGAALLKFEVIDEAVEIRLSDGEYIGLSGCGLRWIEAEEG